MRWLILLILAVASFAAYLLWIHGSADALVATERDVRVRLRALATEPTREVREENGYRFEWVLGQELPDVLVASPARHLFRAPGNRPDLSGLRRYLALGPDERRARGLPGGWQTAE
ncbi:MAG: hypothetical protein ACYSUM_09375 [Planctomycetota bacterium]